MSSRRDFVSRSLTCAGYLLAGLPLASAGARSAYAAASRERVVAEEPWARIEAIADGVWAVVSTPFGDEPHFETVCNGGIIAGRDGVLVIEAFYSDEGAAWVATQAAALTGRRPTHVAVTHHHADHTRGLAGLSAAGEPPGPALRSFTTSATRRRLEEDAAEVDGPAPRLPDVAVDGDEPLDIDLGDRIVRLVPRRGHTASDVTVEMAEPSVVWCGDMVWNGLFPNYVDSIPSRLTRHCEQVLGRPGVTYVPGHGDVADAAALAPYLDLIRDVERAATHAHENGTPPATAAASYAIPESLGEWFLFAPDLYERAFRAWYRELDAGA